MIIYLAKLSKAQLQNLSSAERSLLFILAHLSNEITALEKAVLWSGRYTPGNSAEIAGQVTLMLMFLKLLAGKLNEGRNILQTHFFGQPLAREFFPFLSPESQEAAGKLKRYFGGTNAIHTTRITDAFHYSPNKMDLQLSDVPDEMEIYVPKEGSANNLYYFAEVLANRALLEEVGGNKETDVLHRLQMEIGEAAHWVHVISDDLIKVILGKYVDRIWESAAVEVEIGDPPKFDDIRIPWFVDISGLKEEIV